MPDQANSSQTIPAVDQDLPALPFRDNIDRTNKNIPIETLLDLAGRGLSHEQIATIVGCSRANVTQRLRAEQAHLKGVQYFKKNRADVLAVVQKKIIGAITVKDIADAPLGQKVAAVERLHAMERLESGKSTANIAHSWSDSDRAELAELARIWSQRQLTNEGKEEI